jgi:DNA-directed RNA polymerase specialized sigma24 family protein
MSTAQQALRRHRADDLLAREYEVLRRDVLASVRGQLARRNVLMDDADLDAFYNQAWQGLYDQLIAGREVRNPAGFLVVVCVRRAVDELRRSSPARRAGEEDVADVGREEDHAARMDDRMKLRQFVEGLRDRLTARECQAATLCYLHDYSRAEAASLLGVEPKRMDKIMDSVSKKVGAFVRAIEAGRWCHERGSLMRAYAYGVLAEDGERRRLAGDHLAACSGCRSYVRSLRGLSAALPPVALPLGTAGGPEAAGVLERLGALLDDAGGTVLRLVEEAPERLAAGGAAAIGGGAAATGAGGTAAATSGAAVGGLAGKLAAVVVALAVAGGGASATMRDADARPEPSRPAAAAVHATAAPAAAAAPSTITASTALKLRAAAERRDAAPRERRRARRPATRRPLRARTVRTRTTTSVPAAAAAPAPAPVAAPPAPAPAPAASTPTTAPPPREASSPPSAPTEFGFEGG